MVIENARNNNIELERIIHSHDDGHVASTMVKLLDMIKVAPLVVILVTNDGMYRMFIETVKRDKMTVTEINEKFVDLVDLVTLDEDDDVEELTNENLGDYVIEYGLLTLLKIMSMNYDIIGKNQWYTE